MKITKDYIFFWQESPFCNFTKCKIKFADPYYVELSNKPFIFSSSEQMFMWFKAKFFNDEEIANLIYNTDNPEEAKRLGRQIKNYNDKDWSAVRVYYMTIAITYKFTQNKNLREALLDSKYDGKHFVEASPYDRIWGIGYDQDSALKLDNAKNWGKNELGFILDQVREKMKELNNLIKDLDLQENNV